METIINFFKFILTLRLRSAITILALLSIAIAIVLIEYNYPNEDWDLIDILILNASTKNNTEKLKKIIQEKYSVRNIDIQEEWRQKHILHRTRLIFIDKPSKNNKEKALKIGQEFLNNPMLIDYKNQEKTMFLRERSESLFHSNIFQGFDERRDIVIIIADDYK